MNKYKIKITQEDGKFVGYALLNDEVAFKTEPFNDSISASRKIATLIGSSQAPSPIQITSQKTSSYKPAPSIPVSHTAENPPQQPVRRCCGRG